MMRVLAITFTLVTVSNPFRKLELPPAEFFPPAEAAGHYAPATRILRVVLPPIGLAAIGSIELDSGGCLATGRRIKILVPRPDLLRSTDLFPIRVPTPIPSPEPFLG